jgi:hypothetical protein
MNPDMPSFINLKDDFKPFSDDSYSSTRISVMFALTAVSDILL